MARYYSCTTSTASREVSYTLRTGYYVDLMDAIKEERNICREESEHEERRRRQRVALDPLHAH